MASREWMGFSEEELQLIKKQTSEPDLNCMEGTHDKKEQSLSGKRAKFDSRKNKKNALVEKRLQLLEVKFDDSSIKPEQKLFRSASEGNNILNDKICEAHGQSTLIKVDSESQRYEILPSPSASNDEKRFPESIESCNGINHTQALQEDNPPQPEQPLTSVQRCDEIKSESKIILEEFEQRQKLLEADNAKRKALLLQAIADRKKRTLEESKKIVKIQVELSQLDSLLSSDVSILRREIEEASTEFDKAQKRYERAEKEFVEAKLCVFQRLERKERLTEHLCTIIEQNEARKALKLAEMMQQLGLETLLDTCRNAGNGLTTLLPHLCALNEASYKACQTLKPQISPIEPHSINNNNYEPLNTTEPSTECQSPPHHDA